jgi:hypothetical protein
MQARACLAGPRPHLSGRRHEAAVGMASAAATQ